VDLKILSVLQTKKADSLEGGGRCLLLSWSKAEKDGE
jgi:hypothetical protein